MSNDLCRKLFLLDIVMMVSTAQTRHHNAIFYGYPDYTNQGNLRQ